MSRVTIGGMTATVTVTSFGYRHGEQPEADITIDARRHLRNPHADPAMRYRTGLDADVREHVFDTPGALPITSHTVVLARDLAEATGRIVAVAVGCAGGRHRSVALAEEIAARLREDGHQVTVMHRDVNKPVIQPAA